MFISRSIFVIFLLIFAISSPIFALEAGVTFASFRSNNPTLQGASLELYLHIKGKGLKQLQIDSVNAIGQVQVNVVFKKGTDTAKIERFSLKSPPSLNEIDISGIKAYDLEAGAYDLEVRFIDMQRRSNETTFRSSVVVENFNSAFLRLSDIELLEGVADTNSTGIGIHDNLRLTPLPFNLLKATTPEIKFFAELYESLQSNYETLKVSYSVEKTTDDNAVLVSGSTEKKSSKSPLSIIGRIDLADLPTGFYKFSIVIKSPTDAILTQKSVYFQRDAYIIPQVSIANNSNNEADDSKSPLAQTAGTDDYLNDLDGGMIDYNLRAVALGIAKENEEEYQNTLKNSTILSKKDFLYRYWRGQNQIEPAKAHDLYMMNAKLINRLYSTSNLFGFETDRGKIYIKYGKPDDVLAVDQEGTAIPYEIWAYKKINNQVVNVKFVFYNPSAGYNAHLLLHSNCKGETQNATWLNILYQGGQRGVAEDLFNAEIK